MLEPVTFFIEGNSDMIHFSFRRVTQAAVIVSACFLGAVSTLKAQPVSGAAPLPPVEAGGEVAAGVPAFTVAKGYKVAIAIDAPGESRFMEYDSFGTLYISSPNAGVITSYKRQADGTYQKIGTVVEHKKRVHGMEFVPDTTAGASGGWLWYTTSGGVFKGKVRADGSGLDETVAILPENGKQPSGGGHWWRTILVDDTGFYTSIGDPGNLTDQTGTDREKIWHYSADGKTRELFCAGIRNTEKLRFRPGTTEVWGCDHGSDNFGALLGDTPGNQPITDRIPGEEINHYEKGKFYGHPFIVDANLIRPEFASRLDIKKLQETSIPPEYMLPAHFADCGWTWLNRDFGGAKKGDMCITSHGSWNSSVKVGYCVSLLHFDPAGKPTKAERIISCLDGGRVLGRPVDAIEEPGSGDLLFSVDAPAGKVYRLSATAAHP